MTLLHRLFVKNQSLRELAPRVSLSKLLHEFDVFYVCYDEPNRWDHWTQIKQLLPKAKKVEGVVGFDRALKVCAKRASTSYFFLIDGDNRLLPERLDQMVDLSEVEDHWVLSWSSLNRLNGLTYGNGGLKLWPRRLAQELRSHESALSDDDQTDYCFIADYCLVDNFATETVVTGTHKQAFRAGFREGVKMALDWGRQVELNNENFNTLLGKQNRLRLKVWCEIGDDVPNGCWGILGARFGLKMNVIEKFDYRSINSYLWIDDFLQQKVLQPLSLNSEKFDTFSNGRLQILPLIEALGDEINQAIPLNLQSYSPAASLEFKRIFKNPPRKGLLGRKPSTSRP